MNKNIVMKQSVRRGSEDLWLDIAYEVLLESGVDAVKIMPLAKALNVSRTSFYWYFEDRNALLDALIRRWKEKNTGNLIAQTELYAETIAEAILHVFDCWVNPDIFDARMDFAIRNWAQQSASLKKILEQTDQKRIAALRVMFSRYDFNDLQADVRAHTVYYTQVGYISMMVNEPIKPRLKRMSAYVENFTGRFPTDSEFARFSARHQNRIGD